MKANSTPPLTFIALGRKNSGGRQPPEMPRYTFATFWILLSFVTTELIACSVVEYL